MVSLKLQKRLAASELSCGQRKVWLDPNEVTDISMANSSTYMNHLVLFYRIFYELWDQWQEKSARCVA